MVTTPDLLLHAADTIRTDQGYRHPGPWSVGAGPRVYGLLHDTAIELLVSPTLRHLEHHLALKQVQSWTSTDAAEVVAALIDAAGVDVEPDAALIEARRLLDHYRAALIHRLGYRWENERHEIFANELARRIDGTERSEQRLRTTVRAVTAALAAALDGDSDHQAAALRDAHRQLAALTS